MEYLRKSEDRGHLNFGWLDTYHTFSFGEYHDPEHMGFRSLRVINQDRIDGGKGFPLHPHKNMEIITYVTGGALEHQDTLGNKTVIKPHEVQKMSAGTGIRHSEYNSLATEPTSLLQIWIIPNKEGIAPAYDQKNYQKLYEKNEKLFLVASHDGRDNSIFVQQDMDLYVSLLSKSEKINIDVVKNRHYWIQVVSGSVKTNSGTELKSGDGLGLSQIEKLTLESTAGNRTELLIFDLA